MKGINRKKGFTLIELIVVMAIIAILAAVTIPTTMHFVEKAHDSNRSAYLYKVADFAYDTIHMNYDTNFDSNTLVAKILQDNPTIDDDYNIVASNSPDLIQNISGQSGETITLYYGKTSATNPKRILICRFYIDGTYHGIERKIEID